MVDSKNILLAWELFQQGVSIENIALHCKKHRATISHWIRKIQYYGLDEFIIQYQTVKKKERIGRQVPMTVRKKVVMMKKENPSLSGYSIQKKLKLRHSIHLSSSKIYEILRKERNETT